MRCCERGTQKITRKQIAENLGYTLNSDGISNLICRLFEKAGGSDLVDFTAYVRTLSIILRGNVDDQLKCFFSFFNYLF